MDLQTLLVIDDEPQIRRAIRHAFEDRAPNQGRDRDHVRVLEAGTGARGIDIAAAEHPDLIVLDLGLPDIVGLDVCREVRKWSDAPILVLSARHSDAEKVALLDAGADDYVTKPFSTPELQARVRALMRRTPRHVAGTGPLVIGPLAMDVHARTITTDGRLVHVTPLEWELLRVLMSNAGRTLTHQHLFREVWTGRSFGDAQQHLRVHVAHLRRKIGDDPVHPRYILTEPGVGYRFTTAAELAARR